jgi:hypothetical protein
LLFFSPKSFVFPSHIKNLKIKIKKTVILPVVLYGAKLEKPHNDELHSLYSSPNIVRVIKSRTMRWAGHVARMGKGRDVYRILVGRPEGRDHWEELGVGGRITLRWTLER